MRNKFYHKRFFSFKELNQEFNEIIEKVKKIKIPDGFLQFVFYIISELFDNIKEHSRAKKVSIELTKEKNIFSIKVSDDGIGLRKSYISKGIFPKDDASAIEFALAGLSTKSFQERGYGLYTIRQLIENLKAKMEIKTGKKIALIEKGKINFKENPKIEKGVSVFIESKIQEINIYKIIK